MSMVGGCLCGKIGYGVEGFCPKSGSALFSVGEGAPGMVFVKAGTLDDTRTLAPHMEFWTDSAQSWVKLDSRAKRFARQP